MLPVIERILKLLWGMLCKRNADQCVYLDVADLSNNRANRPPRAQTIAL
jgi:hypothetical protein